MSGNKNLTFRLAGIEDLQFAVIKDAFQESCDINLNIAVPVQANFENHEIGVNLEVQFKCEDKPFIILGVGCHFEIDPESFKTFLIKKKKKNFLVLPVGLCRHLATITVGTARGILYEKLKKTDFQSHILPTIDLTQILTEDIELERK